MDEGPEPSADLDDAAALPGGDFEDEEDEDEENLAYLDDSAEEGLIAGEYDTREPKRGRRMLWVLVVLLFFLAAGAGAFYFSHQEFSIRSSAWSDWGRKITRQKTTPPATRK